MASTPFMRYVVCFLVLVSILSMALFQVPYTAWFTALPLCAIVVFLAFFEWERFFTAFEAANFRHFMKIWRMAGQSIEEQRTAKTPEFTDEACGVCHSILVKDAHYCLACGAPTSDEHALKACFHCNTSMPLDAIFCPHCRFQMERNTDEAMAINRALYTPIPSAPLPEELLPVPVEDPAAIWLNSALAQQGLAPRLLPAGHDGTTDYTQGSNPLLELEALANDQRLWETAPRVSVYP